MKLPADKIKEYDERVSDRAEKAAKRLEHIPNGRVMPDLEDLHLAETKRFSMGVVFVDLVNSGEYLTRNGPRKTIFMLNVFIPQIMDLVKDFNGYFEKNTGDGILAYFGVGQSDRPAVENLLEYLSCLRYTLRAIINPILQEYGVEQVSVSVGAAYAQDVYISRIGIRGQNRRTAISTAANVAFELQEQAEDDEYLVDEGIRTYADREDGWGQFLEQEGVLRGIRWGSSEDGRHTSRYYSFLYGFKSSQGDENV
jgi:class 3 adenylate cyclase